MVELVALTNLSSEAHSSYSKQNMERDSSGTIFVFSPINLSLTPAVVLIVK